MIVQLESTGSTRAQGFQARTPGAWQFTLAMNFKPFPEGEISP
jgi:hypothetical protein